MNNLRTVQKRRETKSFTLQKRREIILFLCSQEFKLTNTFDQTFVFYFERAELDLSINV